MLSTRESINKDGARPQRSNNGVHKRKQGTNLLPLWKLKGIQKASQTPHSNNNELSS